MNIMKIIKEAWIGLLVSLLLGPLGQVVETFAQEAPIPSLDSESAILINSQNGQILLEQDADIKVPVGDFSKLILAYLVLQAVDEGKVSLDDQVNLSNQAYELSQNYQVDNVPLRQDYPYQVKELLKMVAMMGANGATLALSQVIDMDQTQVIEQMNQLLKGWGLSEYNLVNITGLPSDIEEGQSEINQISARDLATITYRLLHDFPEYETYASAGAYDLKKGDDNPFTVNNQNVYLEGEWKIEGVKGLALYESTDASYSQVIHYQQGQEELVAILLGQKSEEFDAVRFSLTQMLEYGMTTYETKTLLTQGSPTEDLPQIKVQGGQVENASLIYKDNLVLSVVKGDNQEEISYDYILDEAFSQGRSVLKAPIASNQVVGKVTAVLQGQNVSFIPTGSKGEVALVQVDEIKELGLIGKALQVVSQFLGMVFEIIRQFFVNLFN